VRDVTEPGAATAAAAAAAAVAGARMCNPREREIT